MSQLKDFIFRNEHSLSGVALFAGFIIDSLTLRRVDLLPETILLYSYLGIAALSIFLIHLMEESAARGGIGSRFVPWLTFLLQFTFGGLFSAFLIFYSRSASLAASWPFLILLLFVFLGTEFFRKFHARLIFQLSVFFFAIFSFCVFSVPIAVGTIGPWVFVLSGVMSVLTFSIFIFLLRFTGRARMRARMGGIIFSTALIFFLINALYFLNILPPIPLALKEIGIYHSVVRTDAAYVLRGEERAWYKALWRPTFHITEGTPLYVFAAVFAPVSLKTDVVHRWQYYDQATATWNDSTIVRFPMIGGRDEGFRGFSLKYGATPGLWRVSVETPSGQLIGRTTFVVEIVSMPPLREEVLR
ncbi:hypothetical protein A2841_00950 [Candidatus Kaiserbacteria bacterium RIFCSPHIGHO2_01_FULL_48_10]|uniref:DUF2914 domain-containing protein n=1 Tax=Candidatus Kaiserbacteria bacterium RIFCSPHIGHO2_01_FULL_48_10 TaxID=1798476 RepID=A0A1F6C5C7_9BACT|nr:MAG: hypothetical protein A2841_00950 [Candidatus Kaiserbacteria bacterium RIFCSPHIGHO2_01_FULL_48_10]